MGTFNEYGCACRCLLKLLADNGKPMTESDFLAAFPYGHWQSSHPDPMPGVTDTSMICDIARKLGLAKGLQVFRGYKAIEQEFVTKKHNVLVCSEIHLNQDRGDTIYHVSLLTGINPAQFSLWCPQQDGSAVSVTYAADHWETKLCHGLVLSGIPAT